MGRSWSEISHPFLRPAGRPGLSTILEGVLVIGEYPTPDDIPWLHAEHGVQAVVSLQDDIDLMYKSIDAPSLQRAYDKVSIEFHRFPVVDGDAEDLASLLGPILQTLHDCLSRNLLTYVHCNAGFNRAPTVAIGYLHAHRSMTLEEAHDFVKTRRPCAPYLSAVRRHLSGSE